jgi:hypothetical protein
MYYQQHSVDKQTKLSFHHRQAMKLQRRKTNGDKKNSNASLFRGVHCWEFDLWHTPQAKTIWQQWFHGAKVEQQQQRRFENC